METVKSRSESPFSRSKTKSQFTDVPENGYLDEQMKAKKKNPKNKCKSQSNSVENEDVTNNKKDFEEEASLNEAVNNVDPNNAKHENINNNDDNGKIENGGKEAQEMEDKENDALVNACEVAEEKNVTGFNSQMTEIGTAEESKTMECATTVDIREDCKEQCTENMMETENSSEKDNLVSSDLPLKLEAECESSEEKCNGKMHDDDNLKEEDNLSPHDEKTEKECLKMKDSSEISVNGSESNLQNEETNAVEDNIQVSPDTATKDGECFSHKITHFLEKWSHPQEEKDSEVSSSKKSEITLNHPYLSKVSGRRGIKEKLNSSATVFSSRVTEAKTPEHIDISLDDSFRVRTNPPRLSSVNLMENPTLRKFKGKRCLNTGEPEDEDDIHANIMKRRKLDDKTQESGILGSILWSPFKKKSLDNGDQLKLATTESKLSRLLSPFWFWKKTAAVQKGK